MGTGPGLPTGAPCLEAACNRLYALERGGAPSGVLAGENPGNLLGRPCQAAL